MTARKTQGLFETRICGIPAQIDVLTYKRVKGSHSYSAESDLDYYGYVEFEFDVYDRKGYPAPWLSKKIDEKEFNRILADYEASQDN